MPQPETSPSGRRRKIAVIAAACSGLLLMSAAITDNYFEISKNMEIFSSLYKELNIYYVDDINPGQVMKTGIDAMLKSLDPYTVYYPESKIEDAMFTQTGQYGGIGTLVNTIEGKITITEPYQGFAAARAGLRAGDMIVRINGKPVDGKTHEEVSDQLTGQPGTEVELTVQRPGAGSPLTFRIKREEIKIPDVPYFALLEDGATGYIKLTGFTESAGSDVKSAFLDLRKEGMKQCILDLRGNGGGLLREAINIVNFFVPKGTEIVQTRGKIEEWNKKYTALNDPLDLQMPLIVLVDAMSASASEIVSGSLQDLDRAVVLGEESFGKGLVQQTKDIAYNTKMKLTVAKYYTPSGRCIQRLDYSHRDGESGEAEEKADSLVKAFRTRNGRTVYDGRGIQPDVEVLPEEMSDVLAGLINDWVIFHWATQFRNGRDQVDSTSFRLTEKDFEAFEDYAASRKITYRSGTLEVLEELEKVAKEERHYDDAATLFADMKSQFTPDTRRDMQRFRKQIQEYLENEIISRYYYQDGRVRHSLPGDPCIARALEVFSADYSSILAGPARK